jgi:hypothetical protein
MRLVSKGKASKIKSSAKPSAVVDFQLVDNGDDTCTVWGVDKAGNQADISSVATIVASSSDTSIITVDPPAGVTFAMHATGKLSTPGSPVSIAVTATWKDGSIGPFSFTLPVDVVAGVTTGVVIVPGTPTTH